MINKEPNYIKWCTLPRNYIVDGDVVIGQCGRKLTQSMLNRNESTTL